MTHEQVEDLFTKFWNSSTIKFEDIANPKHSRPDICAFLMLDELLPSKGNMIISAEHDKIWLDVTWDALVEALSQSARDPAAIILDLVRCHVQLDTDLGGLCMGA